MPEITDQQLAELEALCAAAAPEPWNYTGGVVWGVDDDGYGNPEQVRLADCGQENAPFIAAARTAMPALIAALREARSEIERLESGSRR